MSSIQLIDIWIPLWHLKTVVIKALYSKGECLVKLILILSGFLCSLTIHLINFLVLHEKLRYFRVKTRVTWIWCSPSFHFSDNRSYKMWSKLSLQFPNLDCKKLTVKKSITQIYLIDAASCFTIIYHQSKKKWINKFSFGVNPITQTSYQNRARLFFHKKDEFKCRIQKYFSKCTKAENYTKPY